VAPEREDGTQIISIIDNGNSNDVNSVTSPRSNTGFLETIDSYSATNLNIGR